MQLYQRRLFKDRRMSGPRQNDQLRALDALFYDFRKLVRLENVFFSDHDQGRTLDSRKGFRQIDFQKCRAQAIESFKPLPGQVRDTGFPFGEQFPVRADIAG